MSESFPYPVLALVGPTAIGKTSASIELAQACNCEIISMDSMQVYRYMDVGTAKILPEEMAGIPHHLIDMVDPDQDYDVARYVDDALAAMKAINKRGKTPLFCGGTGLYLKALTQGLFTGAPDDPEIRQNLRRRLAQEGSPKLHDELSLYDWNSALKIHPNDSSRILRGLEIYLASGIPWSEHLHMQQQGGDQPVVGSILVLGLTCERSVLYEKINYRSKLMVNEGLEKEVRGLLEMGYSPSLQAMGSIGYRHMLKYLNKELTKEKMLELLSRDTRRYAKRQYTWFSKTPGMEWFEVTEIASIISRAQEWLSINQ